MQSTLGIDLASQPANTAICMIAWHEDRAQVRVLVRSTWHGTPLHDKLLSTSVQGLWGTGDDDGWGEPGRPTKVAIDAPFGWPDPFARALAAHHGGGPWPETLDNSRAPFERRATDRFVKERTGKQPLSVSTDRIAYPAMRCAVLLADLSRHFQPEVLARDGSGLVAEAYPDAALRMWLPDLWATGGQDSYKGNRESAHERRQSILGAMLKALGPRFEMSPEMRDACWQSDDCLDAFTCALLARAVEHGYTIWPETSEQHELALREGWIHLPQPHSLPGLL